MFRALLAATSSGMPSISSRLLTVSENRHLQVQEPWHVAELSGSLQELTLPQFACYQGAVSSAQIHFISAFLASRHVKKEVFIKQIVVPVTTVQSVFKRWQACLIFEQLFFSHDLIFPFGRELTKNYVHFRPIIWAAQKLCLSKLLDASCNLRKKYPNAP
jgi:hypothetical protein